MKDPRPVGAPGGPSAGVGSGGRWLTPLSGATLVGVVASSAAFVVLAVLVATIWSPSVAGLDDAVVTAAHNDVLAHPWLLAAARAATALGSPLVVDLITLVVAVILLAARWLRAALYVVMVRLLELGLETAVKHLLARPRPVSPDPVAHATGFSFPSGHAAGSTAVYGALLVLIVTAARRPNARARFVGAVAIVVCGVILIAAIGASRVLLGVHYPSDVAGGVLLGMACLFVAQTFNGSRSQQVTSPSA